MVGYGRYGVEWSVRLGQVRSVGAGEVRYRMDGSLRSVTVRQVG